MPTGRCAACNAEATYPAHLGGLTVRCKACGQGWVQVQTGDRGVAPKPVASPPAPRPQTSNPRPAPVQPPPAATPVSDGPVPATRSPSPEPATTYRPLDNGPTPGGGSRVAGWGCLILALPLLLYGAWGAFKVSDEASRGDAGALGGVCGSFLPGLVVVGVAVYLLRRGR